MGRTFLLLYHSYLKSIEPLNDTEKGRLFMALLKYSALGEEPELRGNERFLFPMIREQIDRDNRRYDEICEQNRQNAKRAHATASDRKRSLAVACEGKREGEGEGEGELPPCIPPRGERRRKKKTAYSNAELEGYETDLKGGGE